MLLEEEKNRIRTEEIFRQEVRREIEAEISKQSRGKKLWSVLNSSFALWFLSSIVIAGLTAVVTIHQKNHSEYMQKTDIKRRLNTEITSRIKEALEALHLDIKRIDGGNVYPASSIYNEALHYLDNNVTDGQKLFDFSIYPEYRSRRFRSLIFELSPIVEKSELPQLRQAEATYKQLEKLADQAAIQETSSMHLPSDKFVSLNAAKGSILILKQLQTNDFWQAQL